MLASTTLRGYNGFRVYRPILLGLVYLVRNRRGILLQGNQLRKRQMKTYMIYPPNSYAFEVHAYNEMAAREAARFYMVRGKLPKGTEIYCIG